MNWSGPMSPRSGCRQRTSASRPGDRAVVEADDRLVVQLELVGGDRALEVGAQLEALEHALVHRRLEQPVAALALALGDVHRGVRVADQLVGVRRRAAVDDRDAEAGTHGELLVLDGQRHGERLDDPLGRVGRGLRAVGALEQHGELVAAEAGGGVARADARRQPLRDLVEHLVAGRVAEAVVDGLEVVEVDEDDRQPVVLAPRAGDGVAHALAEQRAVGEVGHRVVERLVGELLLERLALADVAAVEDDAADVLVVEQVRVQDLELPDAAVAVAERALEDLRLAARVRARRPRAGASAGPAPPSR